MNRFTKLLGVLFAAALALSAVAVASASASEFYFSASPTDETITETEPFEAFSVGEPVLTGTAGGIELELSAESAVATGSLDNEGGMGNVRNTQIHFTNVVVTSPFPQCAVNSPGAPAGTVTTEELAGTSNAEPLGVTFTPPSGTFVTLHFSGPTCPINGLNAAVEGSATGEANGEFLEYTETSSNLEFGGAPATFEAVFVTESTGKTVTVK